MLSSVVPVFGLPLSIFFDRREVRGRELRVQLLGCSRSLIAFILKVHHEQFAVG